MEQNPPIWMDGTTAPGEDLRRLTTALMSPGITRLGGLEVTEHSGTPDMSVDVAAGAAFVAGSSSTYQGTYFVENRGTVNETLAAAHATNPRIDLVVARVREDAVDSSGVSEWDVHVVTGTPASAPVTPDTPPNSLPLATISVPALDTAITNSQITSLRMLARPWNSAWGLLGRSVFTSNITGVTSLTAVVSDLTVNLTAGRVIEVTAQCRLNQTGSGTGVETALVYSPSAGGQWAVTGQDQTGAGSFRTHTISSVPITIESSGPQTFRFGVSCTKAVTAVAAATSPNWMTVKDVGPA